MPAQASSSTPAVAAASTPRVDLYAPIHKALRAFMGDTLGRIGRIDGDDRADFDAALGQLETLLDLCRSHVVHENHDIHTAIEARRPGASTRVESEHDEHLEAIAALGADVAALRALPTAAAAHRLYRQLALFVADNFRHMNVEETVHNQALWAAYDDAELLGIHARLLASVPPAEMALVLRWMVPAMTPAERAGMFGGMQQQMPAPALQGLLDTVRPHLDDTAWAKLARALGIAPVPGFVIV